MCIIIMVSTNESIKKHQTDIKNIERKINAIRINNKLTDSNRFRKLNPLIMKLSQAKIKESTMKDRRKKEQSGKTRTPKRERTMSQKTSPPRSPLQFNETGNITERNLWEQKLKNATTLSQLNTVYRQGARIFHTNKGGSNVNFIMWKNSYNRRKRNLT